MVDRCSLFVLLVARPSSHPAVRPCVRSTLYSLPNFVSIKFKCCVHILELSKLFFWPILAPDF